MCRFKRTIIRPNTKHSPGTFRECTRCGIPYCLQIVLTLKFMYKLLADAFKISPSATTCSYELS